MATKAFVPLLIVLSIFANGCGSFVRYMQDEAEQAKVVEVEGFKLRLSKLVSAPGFMTSARYQVESSANEGRWIEAYRWSQDDPWDLSDIDIRTLNPTIGYFFRTTEFGVTVDAGKTWKFFNVYEAMRNDGSDKIVARFDRGVPRVTIDDDGAGSIYVQSYYDESGPTQEIYSTTNFGENWNRAESAKSILK